MKKVAFYTLGCKVNQYETEAIIELFEKEGYEIVDFNKKADIYLINTCTVTSLGDRKSRQIIRRAKNLNDKSIIVVTGCYAQTAPKEVSKIKGVNIIVGTGNKMQILEHIRNLDKNNHQINAVSDISKLKDYEQMDITEYRGRTRAYIKIQEGCNRYCSYCIIPYARGPIRSRNPEDIKKEVERVVNAGFKEIILTGIHLASYGIDLGNTSLMEIIKHIHDIEGLYRIRLSSIEPKILDSNFIEEAAQLSKLCPHYHISLQSGCSSTLKRMNRRYTADEYAEIVSKLRRKIPDVAITTDVMVGFPGETEEEFAASLEFVKNIFFSKVHVFKYSPRKGTPAYSYPNQISAEEKEERSKAMINVAAENESKFYEQFRGKTMEVLFEQKVKNKANIYEGHTSNYLNVRKGFDYNVIGEIVPVEI
jgi:threonylcarbamoyladenosine tRNA methylthiotransferase MtaB